MPARVISLHTKAFKAANFFSSKPTTCEIGDQSIPMFDLSSMLT